MTERITSGQEKQIVRFGSDAVARAIKEARLGKEGAQRIIGLADIAGNNLFVEAMYQSALAALQKLSVSDRYADEEVASNYVYPSEYAGPKPIDEQIATLARIFGLNSAPALEFAKNLPTLPDGAEGWFAVLAKCDCDTVRLVLDKIAESRKFYNYRAGQITADHLRTSERTVRALELVAKQQAGDILVVPAQLGLRHRARSVCRAREIFVANEFGLGSAAVGSIALTHPERFVRWEQLQVDCAGDEFSFEAVGAPAAAPFFYFSDDELKFGTGRVGCVDPRFGTASAFLPQ